MNNDDLKILITGQLNTGKTIGDINVQLRGIEQKINKLRLRVEIDDEKITKILSNFSKQMGKVADISRNAGKIIEEALLPDGTKIKRTFFDGLQGEFSQTVTESKKVQKSLEDQTDQVNDLTNKYKQLTKEQIKYNQAAEETGRTQTFKNGNNTLSVNKDSQGNIKSFSENLNLEKDVTDNQRLIEQMANFREQSIQRRLEEERKLAKAQADAVNKNAELERKEIAKTQQARKAYEDWYLKAITERERKDKLDSQNLANSQDNLRIALKRVYDQGLVNEKFFKNFNKVIDSTKNINEIEKVQKALARVNNYSKTANTVDSYKQQALIEANKLKSTHKKTVDHVELERFLASLSKLNKDTPQAAKKIEQLKLQFSQLKAEAAEAARSSMTVLTAFNTALIKYPVWLAATSIFIGLPRLVTGAINTIVDLDAKLTDLKKVMDSDTNFDSVMSRANESAKEFSKTLSETMDAYTEFARQGFSEQEIPLMADAALIASNVGELEAGKAAELLTSAIIQLKLEAKDAMSIIDSWNEVSNNNATTVEKLANGYARAASIAKIWGMDMHDLNAVIGTVTSSTKQSGQEVGNFIKNVLPRLTSQPAQDALNMVGVSLTDESGNLKNALQIYKEVSQEFVKMDKLSQNIVAEGLAGKYHISRMTALLSNMDMVEKMLSESQNSSNSARIENDRYMQSLEARIKKTKQAFEELSLAVGKAFLTESFIEFLQVTKDIANTATVVSKSVGVLPVIFGMVGTAAILMSKSFRTAVVEMKVMQAGMTGLTITARGLSTAFKGLMASTGVGLAFAGIGFAIEKLLASMGKARAETEEFERKNKELMMSYKENKDVISDLAKQYEELDSKIKSGKQLNSDEISKYNQIVQDLSKHMPSLVIGEDSYGNKILASAEFIKLKTKQLEKQLEIQEKIEAKEQKEKAKSDYDSAKKLIDDNKDRQKDLFKDTNLKLNPYSDGVYTTVVQDIDDLIKKIDELEKKKNNSTLTDTEQRNLQILKNAYDEYEKLQLMSNDAQISMQNASVQMIESMIKTEEQMSATSKSFIQDFSMMVATSGSNTKTLDKTFSSLKDNLESNGDFKEILNNYGDAIDEYKNKIQNGLSGDDLKGYQEKAQKAFENLKNTMLDIAKDSGVSKDTYNKLSAQLDIASNSALGLDESLDSLSRSTGKSKEELMAELAVVPEAAEAMDTFADSTMNAVQAEMEKASTAELIVGTTQAQIDKTHEAIAVIQMLSAQEYLSAQQKQELSKANEYLASTYPHLVDNKQANIEAILEEAESNNILIKAVEAAANGQLTAQEKATLGTGLSTKARIDHMKEEIKSLKTVIAAYGVLADASMEQIAAQMNAGALSPEIGLPLLQAKGAMKNYEAQLDSLVNSLGGVTLELNKIPAIQDKTSKSTKGASDSYEHATYVSDKFKQKLEEINLQLEKQQAIQKKFPNHSKEYQKALQNEISLLSQKKKLLEQQSKELDNQIKSGKIQEVGKVVTTSSSSSGSYSGQYASIINQAASKYGVDPNLVAAIIKQESGFNAKARSSAGAMGLMQLMPGTARGLGVTNAYDPFQNIMGGTKYIKQMLDMFGGNLQKALAAYNAGAGNVKKYNGIPPFKETQNYVQKVLANYQSSGGSSKTVSNTSKEAAETAQSIDQAKSELINLQQDALQIEQEIQQLRLKLIDAELSVRENAITQIDSKLKLYEDALDTNVEGSKNYLNNLSTQITLLNQKKGHMQSELVYLEKQIKGNKELTAESREQLKEKYNNIKIQQQELALKIKEVNWQKALSALTHYDKQIEDLGYLVQLEESYRQHQEKGSNSYLESLEKQEGILNEIIKNLETEKRTAEHILRTQKLDASQKEEIKKKIQQINLELGQTRNEILDIEQAFKDIATDTLVNQKEAYLKSLEEQFNSIKKQKEADIENTEKYFDSLIELQEEKLKLLDEEIEKEDRLKQLREIDQKITDVKNDERFSYITVTGEEILTFNKGQVSELEKERNEMVEQFEREDLKSAIQNEIDRLNKAKNDKVEILRQEVELLQEQYDKQVEETEKYWDNLIIAIEEGTFNFDEMMSGFYGKTIEEMSKFNSDIASQVETLKNTLSQIASLKSQIESESNNTSSTSDKTKTENNPSSSSTALGILKVRNKSTGEVKKIAANYLDSWIKKGYVLEQYHEGGIVGKSKGNRLTELANKLFNKKPGEQIVKSLVGELQVPPKNIPNVFTNIGNIVNSLIPKQPMLQPVGDTFLIQHLEIKTDNVEDMQRQLQMKTRMYKP